MRAGTALQRHVAESFAAAKAVAPFEGELTMDDRHTWLKLLQHSMVLSPAASVDPVGAFSMRFQKTAPPPIARATAELATIAELEERLLALPVVRSASPSRDAQPLFRAAAKLGVDAVEAAMRVTRVRWAGTTDMSSANALCCLAAVGFIDERAFAIAEAVNPREDAAR